MVSSSSFLSISPIHLDGGYRIFIFYFLMMIKADDAYLQPVWWEQKCRRRPISPNHLVGRSYRLFPNGIEWQNGAIVNTTQHKRIIISLWVRSMRHRLSCIGMNFSFANHIELSNHETSRSLSFFCVRYICVSTFSVVAGSGDYCVVVLPFSLVSKIERLTTVAYLPAKEKGKKKTHRSLPPVSSCAFMYCN